MNEHITSLFIGALFGLVIFILLGILFREMVSAWIATINHKKHGTYDKEPDLNHRCIKCNRPFVKKDNGNMYCAWCDREVLARVKRGKY